ncbi:MAG: phosphoribosylformylglycinamidine cyclo-ligase [Rhodanobacteraceae bacterium]|nr:phosphoribosylformylglycinamidine cyclo-ligase [Rhodanobacteraceae bacterium]
MTQHTPMTYRDAGVDIDAGNSLVERIKPAVRRTMRPEVLAGVGGFGASVRVPLERYREPVMVSGTDGVGTKLKLAQQLGRHDTIGIDLVGMCVNDVLVQGAEPVFFLDYFATGKLDVDTAAAVVAGIARGCEESGCALVGGETAEMPDMYPPGEYDLAGFCVGLVERSKMLDGSSVQAGHRLVGIASSGPHSNGYSLIRRILARAQADLSQDCGGRALGDALMAPTRLYVKPVLGLLADLPIAAMAHITGGGITENIIRVVPEGLGLAIDGSAWPEPAVFQWLMQAGQVARSEMWRTFNCGIGFVLVLPAEAVAGAIERLAVQGLPAWDIGEVVAHAGEGERVHIR